VIENFIETKSWSENLEGLKRKVDLFIETVNIYNLFFIQTHIYSALKYDYSFNFYRAPLVSKNSSKEPK